ncbi:MAG: hypothetical protein VXV97_03965 [Pseudomonadota bacterium]|nr:hypothetical protein [Pseudomonadota bacterium]
MENQFNSILEGNRRALARAITLIESTRADHREQAEAQLAALMPHCGHSVRVGIPAPPALVNPALSKLSGCTW